MTDGSGDLTAKQYTILEELRGLGSAHPTVRSLADRLQGRGYRTERWSDDEVRGLLERLEDRDQVVQYTGAKGEARYRLSG